MGENKEVRAVDGATAMILQELGKISGKLDAMEQHNRENRELQQKQNEAIWKKLDDHDERIRHNETNIAKRAGIISAATGVGIAILSEAIKHGLKG